MSIGSVVGLLHGLRGGLELGNSMRQPDANGQVAPRRGILEWLGLREGETNPNASQQGAGPPAAYQPGIQSGQAPRQVMVGAPASSAQPQIERKVQEATVAAPVAAAPAVKLTPALAAAIGTTREKYSDVPEGYLERLAMIESSGGTRLDNPTSSAKGPFQFIDGTAATYGLSDPTDPAASADAAARLTRDNRKALLKALGRDPTPGELYLAHQQGAGGASSLLTSPDKPAVDIVGRRAVIDNGGREDMSGREFAAMWTSKFGGGSGKKPTGMAAALMKVRGAN